MLTRTQRHAVRRSLHKGRLRGKRTQIVRHAADRVPTIHAKYRVRGLRVLQMLDRVGLR
jgi:hypothetical protein